MVGHSFKQRELELGTFGPPALGQNQEKSEPFTQEDSRFTVQISVVGIFLSFKSHVKSLEYLAC